MGRIKTDMVKRTAGKLVDAHPEKFTKAFSDNKLALKDLAEIRSKKLRNVIAGYTVRLKLKNDDSKPKAKKKRFTGGSRFMGGPGDRPPRGDRGDRQGGDRPAGRR